MDRYRHFEVLSVLSLPVVNGGCFECFLGSVGRFAETADDGLWVDALGDQLL